MASAPAQHWSGWVDSNAVTAWLAALGLDDVDAVGDLGCEGTEAPAWRTHSSVFWCPPPPGKGGRSTAAAAVLQALAALGRGAAGAPAAQRVYLLLPSDTATAHFHLLLRHATLLAFSRLRACVRDGGSRRPALLAVLEAGGGQEATGCPPVLRALEPCT